MVWLKKNLIPLVLFLLTLGIYTYTLAPSVAPQGDSGELVTVAYTLGIAHPPGYPLFTLLGHLFTFIPLGTIAARVNFLSAVCHSLALVFAYLILKNLTKNTFAAVISSLILAFSYTFWLYSLVAEVFSLNDLLILVLIYLALTSQKYFLMGIVFGLGLSNHHTIVMTVPIVFLFTWKNIKKTIVKNFIKLSLGTFVGLLPYLYILIRANTAIMPVAWTYPNDHASLLKMFLRSDYGTLVAYSGSDPALATLTQKFDQIVNYLKFLSDDFGYFGLILFAFGLYPVFRKHRYVLLGLIIGIFFIIYANFPIKEFVGSALAIVERFYLFPNLFITIIIGFGITSVYQFCVNKPVFRILIPIIIVSLVGSLFIQNFGLVNQRDNYKTLKLGKSILDNAPPKSTVIMMGDLSTFSTFYARYVEQYRPDVEIFTENYGLPGNRFKYFTKTRRNLDLSWDKNTTLATFIAKNHDRTPLYIFGNFPMAVPGFIASPSGFLFKIFSNDNVIDNDEWVDEIEKNEKDESFNDLDDLTLADRVLLGIYAIREAQIADWCARALKWECAEKFYNKSLNYDASFAVTYRALGQVYANENKCDLSQQSFEKALLLSKNYLLIYEDLYDLAIKCFKSDDKVKYYESLKNQYSYSEQNDLKKL